MKRSTYINILFLSMFVISCMFVNLSLVKPSTYAYNLENESRTKEVSEEEFDLPISAVTDIQTDQKEENSVESIEEVATVESVEYISYYIELTEDEIWDLATLVYLESGGESYECQLAVASVVINRVTTSDKSLYDVIYEKNQFTPAHRIESNEPSESTMNAVKEVCTNGPTIPEYVTYFRAEKYHSFSEYIMDYMCIDNTYFSYDINLKSTICKG